MLAFCMLFPLAQQAVFSEVYPKHISKDFQVIGDAIQYLELIM